MKFTKYSYLIIRRNTIINNKKMKFLKVILHYCGMSIRFVLEMNDFYNLPEFFCIFYLREVTETRVRDVFCTQLSLTCGLSFCSQSSVFIKDSSAVLGGCSGPGLWYRTSTFDFAGRLLWLAPDSRPGTLWRSLTQESRSFPRSQSQHEGLPQRGWHPIFPAGCSWEYYIVKTAGWHFSWWR